MKETILQLVTTYSYYGLFLSLILGIVGIPIPDEILMTYCGYLISQGEMIYWVTLLTAFFGSVAGITISYCVGRRFGLPMVEKYGWRVGITRFGLPMVEKYGRRVGITSERLDKVNHWYGRYGKIVLLIGYFIPGIRHVTAFAAGLGRMPFAVFAFYAYTGGLIWTCTFITLGKMLGVHWMRVSVLSHRFLFWSLLFAASGFLMYVLLRWQKKARHPR